MEIYAITNEHKLWNETISFAETCSWKGGHFLAGLMNQNNFLEWERVFVAFENNKIVGYCTFTKKDELSEEYDFSPFIGFIFVDESYRGRRISEMMINNVMKYAKMIGYDFVYIMSGEKGLYEKYGFTLIGNYETIYGNVEQLFRKNCHDQKNSFK